MEETNAVPDPDKVLFDCSICLKPVISKELARISCSDLHGCHATCFIDWCNRCIEDQRKMACPACNAVFGPEPVNPANTLRLVNAAIEFGGLIGPLPNQRRFPNARDPFAPITLIVTIITAVMSSTILAMVIAIFVVLPFGEIVELKKPIE